jgi:hypothetical protein
MGVPEILVVGETPSLGRAIADLLDAAGLPSRLVAVPRPTASEPPAAGAYRVVVAACNAPESVTALAWHRGEFPRSSLVVVGSRYGVIPPSRNVEVIRLPLDPPYLVALVRRLLETPYAG